MKKTKKRAKSDPWNWDRKTQKLAKECGDIFRDIEREKLLKKQHDELRK